MWKWIASMMVLVILALMATCYVGYRNLAKAGDTVSVAALGSPSRVFALLADRDSIASWLPIGAELTPNEHGVVRPGDTLRISTPGAPGDSTKRQRQVWVVRGDRGAGGAGGRRNRVQPGGRATRRPRATRFAGARRAIRRRSPRPSESFRRPSAAMRKPYGSRDAPGGGSAPPRCRESTVACSAAASRGAPRGAVTLRRSPFDEPQRRLPGSANATYVPPDGAPFFPPPHAMTTYCLPFTMYVDGVALPAAGSVVSQSSLPVALS